MKLRTVHHDAIRLLATKRGSYEEIALSLGFSARTLQRWRRDADFQAALACKMAEPQDALAVRGTIYRTLGALLSRLESEGSGATTAETLELFGKLVRDFRLLDLGTPDKEADRVARLQALARARRRNERKAQAADDADEAEDDGPETEDEWDPDYLADPKGWIRRERENARKNMEAIEEHRLRHGR